MLILSISSFFHFNGVYIALGIACCAIVISFIYRLKNQDKDVNEVVNSQDFKVTNKGIDINLKMQAYERLTIFLERTDPVRLLSVIEKKERD